MNEIIFKDAQKQKPYKVAIVKGKFKGLIGRIYYKMNDGSGIILKREFSNKWYIAKYDEVMRF